MHHSRIGALAVGGIAGATLLSAFGANQRFPAADEENFSWSAAFQDAPVTVPLGAAAGAGSVALMTRGRPVAAAMPRSGTVAYGAALVGLTGIVGATGWPGVDYDDSTRTTAFLRAGLGVSMVAAPTAAMFTMLARR